MKRKNIICFFLSFVIPVIIIALIFYFKDFNQISNLTSDLYYHYIDFFSWFRKQLLDKTLLSGYSFSISLGNTSLPLIAYYLASPLNFLIVFFSQESIPKFVLLITALKIGLSGFSMYCYLHARFISLQNSYKLCASTGYALMYYNVAQATNIMWLDGVYMLPFILLGAYYILDRKKGILFSVAVCLSILFNWYTAYMNCLFVFLYFIYELSLNESSIKKIVKRVLSFCLYELAGVLLSCFFFLPVIFGMLQSKTSYETTRIFNPKLRGNLLELIKGGFLGNTYTDSDQTLSLYCGTIFLILLIIFFLYKGYEKRRKTLTLVFFSIMILSTQIIAIENIWNGFRYASSFYCRFSYLVSFLIIFIGIQILDTKSIKPNLSRLICYTSITLLVIYSLFDLISPADVKVYSVCNYILILYIIWGVIVRKKYAGILLLGIVCFELFLNGVIVYRTGNDSIDQYTSYTQQANSQIQRLFSKDNYKEKNNFYRIDETMNRQMSTSGIAAAYNDSMAYGYSGLANYSSTTYSEIVQFSSDLGYYEIGHYIIPYSEPILASDSLLGIRYVMSQRNLPGFDYVTDLSSGLNGKNVYYNQYALPLGILTSENILTTTENDNPFLFQNEIYSKILGENCQIFKPMIYNKEKKGNSIIINTQSTNDSSDIIYAYANTTSSNLPVYIDDEFLTDYNQWLSYQTMCIGNGKDTHTVRFDQVDESADEFGEHIYYLDMDYFKEVIKKLKQTAFNPNIVNDGYIEGTYQAKQEELLLLTVPFDTGWKVTINDDSVAIQRGMNAFIVFPVNAGENQIICEYHVPGIKPGIILSLCGAILLSLLEKQQRNSLCLRFNFRRKRI